MEIMQPGTKVLVRFGGYVGIGAIRPTWKPGVVVSYDARHKEYIVKVGTKNRCRFPHEIRQQS